MSQFLFLFRGGDDAALQESPEKWQEHMQKWMDWMGELQSRGLLVGADPLNPSGKIVKGTRKVITDGPFMEGKEMVGGYMICKIDSLEKAVQISKDCPILEFEDGTIEIREIQEIPL